MPRTGTLTGKLVLGDTDAWIVLAGGKWWHLALGDGAPYDPHDFARALQWMRLKCPGGTGLQCSVRGVRYATVFALDDTQAPQCG